MSIAHPPNKTRPRVARKGRDPLLHQLLLWGVDRRRMSGRELATASGVNQSIVSRLLSGKRCNPTVDTAKKLGDVLGIEWPVILEAGRRSRAVKTISPVLG